MGQGYTTPLKWHTQDTRVWGDMLHNTDVKVMSHDAPSTCPQVSVSSPLWSPAWLLFQALDGLVYVSIFLALGVVCLGVAL